MKKTVFYAILLAAILSLPWGASWGSPGSATEVKNTENASHTPIPANYLRVDEAGEDLAYSAAATGFSVTVTLRAPKSCFSIEASPNTSVGSYTAILQVGNISGVWTSATTISGTTGTARAPVNAGPAKYMRVNVSVLDAGILSVGAVAMVDCNEKTGAVTAVPGGSVTVAVMPNSVTTPEAQTAAEATSIKNNTVTMNTNLATVAAEATSMKTNLASIGAGSLTTTARALVYDSTGAAIGKANPLPVWNDLYSASVTTTRNQGSVSNTTPVTIVAAAGSGIYQDIDPALFNTSSSSVTGTLSEGATAVIPLSMNPGGWFVLPYTLKGLQTNVPWIFTPGSAVTSIFWSARAHQRVN